MGFNLTLTFEGLVIIVLSIAFAVSIVTYNQEAPFGDLIKSLNCILPAIAYGGTAGGDCPGFVKPPRSYATTCADTDSGLDYYTKGRIYGQLVGTYYSLYDYCQGQILYEYFCTGDRRTVTNYTCPGGCYDGRCNVTGLNVTVAINTTKGIYNMGEEIVLG